MDSPAPDLTGGTSRRPAAERRTRFETAASICAAEAGKPYRYGVSDCFMLGCRMADAIAGRTMAATFGGSYSTLLGANRALRRRGYASLVGFFEDRFPRIGAGSAIPGDLAVALLADGEHVCVCVDHHRFATKTPAGMRLLPPSAMLAAFAVR